MVGAMWLLSVAVVLLIVNTYLMEQRILDLKHALWDSYDWIDPVACVTDELEMPEQDEGEENQSTYVGRH